MTNLERFNEAFGHMEHRVMGRRLAKFSLRHRFWLEAMESPLVSGGEVVLLDLELASRVCAIPFGKLDVALPRMLAAGPGWWGRMDWMVRAWGRQAGREYRNYQAYLLDHGCPPAVWGDETVAVGGEDGEEAEDNGALPGMLGLVSGLIRCTGWDPEVVWALSPGEAEWYLAGVFTHRGVDVGLMTAADEIMLEMLAKRKEARGQKPESRGEEESTAEAQRPQRGAGEAAKNGLAEIPNY
jgi:hypothetical protein